MTTQGSARATVGCDGSVLVEVTLTTKEYIHVVEVSVGDKSDSWQLPPSTGDGQGLVTHTLTFRFAASAEAPTQFSYTDRDGNGNIGVHVEAVLYRYEDSCQVETTVPEAPVTTVVVTPLPTLVVDPTVPPSIPLPIGVISTEAPTTTVAAIQEDSDLWDCATMGNRVCGPTETTAVVQTVPSKPGERLPETGSEPAIAGVGVLVLVVGLVLRRVARR